MSENGETAKRKAQLSIPVDDDLLARIRLAAEREHRSVANFARIALARAVEQQEAAA
jgi:predicted transcriptional regulator